jgi:hypothetical protein
VERDQPTAPVGTVTTWLRYLLIAIAWLFAIGVIVQIFLAGLSLFESSKYWEDHEDMGYTIGILAYLLPFIALGGRAGVRLFVHAVVVAVLYQTQITLPEIDTGWIAALHPVNAFLLGGSSGSLGARTLLLVRSAGPSGISAARS